MNEGLINFFGQDFLKCTPNNHLDYQLLIKAQKELHTLAEKIDQVHKEVNECYGSDTQSILQIIQDLIENLDDVNIIATSHFGYSKKQILSFGILSWSMHIAIIFDMI